MILIDADTLNYVRVRIYHDDGTIGGYNAVVPSSEIKNSPTVDAVPVEWIEIDIEQSAFTGYDMHSYEVATMLEEWKEKERKEEK